ncbi:unnamed protein product [Symbiodinium sp. CCMP2592]|nr:unnamed protein product [Symbiodinium sp. CCMP2592]
MHHAWLLALVALRAVALRESGVEENLDVDEPRSGLQDESPVNPVDAASKARAAEMEALQKAQDLERLAAVAELHVMEERDVAIRAENEVAGGRHANAVGQSPSGSPPQASIFPASPGTAVEATTTSTTATTTTSKKDEEFEDDDGPVQPVLVAPRQQVEVHQTFPSINYRHAGIHQLPQPLEITSESHSAPVPILHATVEEVRAKTKTTTSTTATTVTTEETSSSDEDEDESWEDTSRSTTEEATGRHPVGAGTEHRRMLETSTTEVEADFEEESEGGEESTSLAVALEAKPSVAETTTEEVWEAPQTSSTEVAISAVSTTEELQVEDVVEDVRSATSTSTSEEEEDDDFTDFGDDGSSSTSGAATESPSTTRTSPEAATRLKKVDDEDEDMQIKPVVVVPEQVEAHQTFPSHNFRHRGGHQLPEPSGRHRAGEEADDAK